MYAIQNRPDMDKRDENIIEPSPKGNWFSPQIREKQHALQSNELSIRILETIGSSILALAVYFCIFIFNAMVWDSPYILWQIVLIKQPTGQKKAFDEESNNTQGMAINQISCRSKTCLSPNWFAASPNSPPCTIWNCCSYLAVPRQKKRTRGQ